MKCTQCGSQWPQGTKFCGSCGARLETQSGLGSAAAIEVNNRLREYLPRLKLGPFREVRPGIHLGHKGSAHVEVRILPMGPHIAIRSMSRVTIGSTMRQNLLEFLLKENANLLFGAFGVGPRNEIVYTHTIMASSLDVQELGASVSAVINMADKYDDEIVKKWGGKTAKQSAVDQILAPALLKAFIQSKAPVQKPRTPTQSPPTTLALGESQQTVAMPQTPGVSNAIKVNSVAEEYAYLSRQRCICGGRYERGPQALRQIGGKMFDEISVSCAECGNERSFLFDINSFFGRR